MQILILYTYVESYYMCVYIQPEIFIYTHYMYIYIYIYTYTHLYIYIYIDIYIQPEITMKGRARVSNRTKKMLCLLHSDQAFFRVLAGPILIFVWHIHMFACRSLIVVHENHIFVGLIQLLAGCSLNVRFCRPIMPIRRLIPNLHW